MTTDFPKAGWQELLRYWNTLDFEKAKERDLVIKQQIGDDLEFSEEDIERLKTLCSLQRVFLGASEDEIEEIENSLQVNLPLNFKESLRINCHETAKGDDIYPWLGGWNILLDCKAIMKLTLRFRAYDFALWDSVHNVEKVPKAWSSFWIPFFSWNNDYFAVLDLRQDIANPEQILCASIEDRVIAKWAGSYEDWFELAVNEVLQYGELRVETIEKVLNNNNH